MIPNPKMPAVPTALTDEQLDGLLLRATAGHTISAARGALERALAGLSDADVERACNGPLLWEGDQA